MEDRYIVACTELWQLKVLLFHLQCFSLLEHVVSHVSDDSNQLHSLMALVFTFSCTRASMAALNLGSLWVDALALTDARGYLLQPQLQKLTAWVKSSKTSWARSDFLKRTSPVR